MTVVSSVSPFSSRALHQSADVVVHPAYQTEIGGHCIATLCIGLEVGLTLHLRILKLNPRVAHIAIFWFIFGAGNCRADRGQRTPAAQPAGNAGPQGRHKDTTVDHRLYGPTASLQSCRSQLDHSPYICWFRHRYIPPAYGLVARRVQPSARIEPQTMPCPPTTCIGICSWSNPAGSPFCR